MNVQLCPFVFQLTLTGRRSASDPDLEQSHPFTVSCSSNVCNWLSGLELCRLMFTNERQIEDGKNRFVNYFIGCIYKTNIWGGGLILHAPDPELVLLLGKDILNIT